MGTRTRLSDEQVTAFLNEHAGWARRGDALARTYTFEDFGAALGFAVRVGVAAERRDHHPDLAVGYGKVEVVWTTHDAGGVTALDVEMAERTDRLAGA
ncbi:MAG TPA: 4a-hydroxytetrahydrobiopterin dehydratase [Minicystis sp.]|nr:4a-hydroxytetrahydrobiopterin dehydratase [Minicystis sp.]